MTVSFAGDTLKELLRFISLDLQSVFALSQRPCMFPVVEMKSRIMLKVEATEECEEFLRTQARLR